MLCYRKGLARRGAAGCGSGGRRPRGSERPALPLSRAAGRPCPGKQSGPVGHGKKTGRPWAPLSCCIPARARSPTDHSSRDSQGGGGPVEDPGRSARASSPRAAKAALSASGAAYRRAHTRTPRRRTLRVVQRPGRGSSRRGPTWGPDRAASRAGRNRTAGAAAARAERGTPAPG